MTTRFDNPGVWCPPPLWFVLAILVGILLNRLLALPIPLVASLSALAGPSGAHGINYAGKITPICDDIRRLHRFGSRAFTSPKHLPMTYADRQRVWQCQTVGMF